VWFNLDADLRPWFHWNTKQLHVYAVVAFETPQHHSNEIVIWDHIVTSVDQARLQLSKQKAEYLVSDIAHKLSGLNGTLRLEWNVVPWVG
ncbi:signal peptidase 22 kDa subunit, partial [Caulochytrium protostelioides]